MNRVEVFENSVLDYNGNLSEEKGAFKLIENSIASIDALDLTEEEKKKKLVSILNGMKNTTLRRLNGLKSEHIKKIIDEIFQIRADTIMNPSISNLNLQDILYYVSVTDRLAVTGANLKDDILEKKEREKKAEEERIKKLEVEKKKIEEEKHKKELALLEKLSEGEELIYKLKKLESEDGEYDKFCNTEIYPNIDKFDEKEKIIIAKGLKEYWIRNDKWEGKQSKKQEKKIKKIQGILKDI